FQQREVLWLERDTTIKTVIRIDLSAKRLHCRRLQQVRDDDRAAEKPAQRPGRNAREPIRQSITCDNHQPNLCRHYQAIGSSKLSQGRKQAETGEGQYKLRRTKERAKRKYCKNQCTDKPATVVAAIAERDNRDQCQCS